VKNISVEEKLLLRLTFNPGLALAGFRATRPRAHTYLFILRDPGAVTVVGVGGNRANIEASMVYK